MEYKCQNEKGANKQKMSQRTREEDKRREKKAVNDAQLISQKDDTQLQTSE